MRTGSAVAPDVVRNVRVENVEGATDTLSMIFLTDEEIHQAYSMVSQGR